MLLDVNNVYVSSFNHGFDPKQYLDAIPTERVTQYHLAGHTNKGTHIIDTHNDYVIDPVWELYRHSVARTGNVSTLLEWDADIPAFEIVHAEALKAAAFRRAEKADEEKALEAAASCPAAGPRPAVDAGGHRAPGDRGGGGGVARRARGAGPGKDRGRDPALEDALVGRARRRLPGDVPASDGRGARGRLSRGGALPRLRRLRRARRALREGASLPELHVQPLRREASRVHPRPEVAPPPS